MANLLEELKAVTVVVADTGDFESIQKFRPRDATTNPSLIAAAAAMPRYQPIVDAALRWAKHEGKDPSPAAVCKRAVDRLAVEFGIEILKVVPGRVSTEVDARLSYDTAASIAKARDLIAMYEQEGIARARILIKLAATWEGIKAAEVLEQEGIALQPDAALRLSSGGRLRGRQA
jgi:transaldolase